MRHIGRMKMPKILVLLGGEALMLMCELEIFIVCKNFLGSVLNIILAPSFLSRKYSGLSEM